MSCNGSLDDQQIMIITVVQSSVSSLSFISCLLAIGALFYYKLHHSFNHRLVLYLSLGIAGVSLVRVLDFPVPWYATDSALMTYYCRSLASLSILTTWVSLLFTFILVAELFSLVLCFVELRRIEIPYLSLSLILPVGVFWVPFFIELDAYRSYGCWQNTLLKNCSVNYDNAIAEYILWNVPAYVTFGSVIPMILAIVVTMVIRWCRYKWENHRMEMRHLLESDSIHKYSKALRETTSLLSYLVIVCAVIVVWSFVKALRGISSFWPELVYAVVLGSMGWFTALSVAIHLLALGTAKRAALRKGSKGQVNRNIPRSELASCINEGAEYAAAGSMTVTHPTEFEPPTESEVDC